MPDYNTQPRNQVINSPANTNASGAAGGSQQQTSTPAQLSQSKLAEAVAFNKKAGYYPQLWIEIQKKAKTGADGAPGWDTARKIATYQKEHSLNINGKADEPTMKEMDLHKFIGKLPVSLEELWTAHPHNYQANESENTSSADLLQEEGLPTSFENTCACRLSVMFNRLGGNFKIDKKKAIKAGIRADRVFFSKKTKNYYIVSAKEMWNYVSLWFGSPHAQFPKGGTYKTEDEFTAAWDSEVSAFVSSKKGIVAFNTIFGYGGTGHVDVFNGQKLSDAPYFYPCKQLKLWFV